LYTAGAGGAGVATSITGASQTLAAGGRGLAGNEGGAVAGDANTGEGGGGDVRNTPGKAGGSGIVIVRYPIGRAS